MLQNFNNKLKFKRDTLLQKVKENRKKHWEAYIEAMDAYRAQLIEELQLKLQQAIDKQDVEHHLRLQRPVEYIKDYDQIIAMLDMTSDENIELDQNIFAQLILDQWTWKDSFTSNTTSYLNKHHHRR